MHWILIALLVFLPATAMAEYGFGYEGQEVPAHTEFNFPLIITEVLETGGVLFTLPNIDHTASFANPNAPQGPYALCSYPFLGLPNQVPAIFGLDPGDVTLLRDRESGEHLFFTLNGSNPASGLVDFESEFDLTPEDCEDYVQTIPPWLMVVYRNGIPQEYGVTAIAAEEGESTPFTAHHKAGGQYIWDEALVPPMSLFITAPFTKMAAMPLTAWLCLYQDGILTNDHGITVSIANQELRRIEAQERLDILLPILVQQPYNQQLRNRVNVLHGVVAGPWAVADDSGCYIVNNLIVEFDQWPATYTANILVATGQ